MPDQGRRYDDVFRLGKIGRRGVIRPLGYIINIALLTYTWKLLRYMRCSRGIFYTEIKHTCRVSTYFASVKPFWYFAQSTSMLYFMQNDLRNKTDVMGERDFSRFQFFKLFLTVSLDLPTPSWDNWARFQKWSACDRLRYDPVILIGRSHSTNADHDRLIRSRKYETKQFTANWIMI